MVIQEVTLVEAVEQEDLEKLNLQHTPYTASPLDGYPSAPNRVTVTATAFPITVGAGGASQPYDGSQGPNYNPTAANDGSNSVFSTITAAGGGGGGGTGCNAAPCNSGRSGGSGGGAGASPGASGGTGNTPPTSPAQGQSWWNWKPQVNNNPILGGGGGGAGAAGTAGAPGGAGRRNWW